MNGGGGTQIFLIEHLPLPFFQCYFLALIHWFTFSSHLHIHLIGQYIIWTLSFSCHILEDLYDTPTPLAWIVILMWFQIFSMRWLNRSVHLWLLPVLLLRTLWYVGFHANFFLFRVHGLHLLWLLSDARNCRLPCSPVLCSSHLQVDQMRVADLVSFPFLFCWWGRKRRRWFSFIPLF